MAAGWLKSMHCKNNAMDDVVHPLTPSASSSSAATGWLKSLHCKSNAMDDVVHPLTPSPSSSSSAAAAKKPLLSCGNTSDAVKDVVFLFPKYPSTSSSSSATSALLPKKPSRRTKPKRRPTHPCASPAAPGVVGVARAGTFPVLEEIPPGHSSRRVVEIIFSSSWCSFAGSGAAAAFPGEIEMLFRVHNPAREAVRFEEHRTAVRARSHDARCAADGNEMMRFHCGGAGGAGGAGMVYDAGVTCSAMWSGGRKVEGVRTFAGSGGAHASSGGGTGRRAMLVCRVIAGRVRSESDHETVADSVSLMNGELVVFDPRAVLPCFLIIYKL